MCLFFLEYFTLNSSQVVGDGEHRGHSSPRCPERKLTHHPSPLDRDNNNTRQRKKKEGRLRCESHCMEVPKLGKRGTSSKRDLHLGETAPG